LDAHLLTCLTGLLGGLAFETEVVYFRGNGNVSLEWISTQ